MTRIVAMTLMSVSPCCDRIKEEPSADIQFPVLDENDEVSEADLLQLEGK